MESMLIIPKLLGDNCVLQRGTATRIWGKGIPGARMDIALLTQSREIVARCAAIADETGAFVGYFEALCAGGPYCLRFLSGEEEAVSRNVYVGDVFVCAGQSNMELPMRRVRERYPEEFLNAAYLSDDWKESLPFVHVYKVQEDYDFKQEAAEHKNAQWGICRGSQREALLKWEPQAAAGAACQWQALSPRRVASHTSCGIFTDRSDSGDAREGAFPCASDQLAEVSAFSYFLGKELSEEKGIPVGILNLSLGGTPIQAWMSEEGLKNWPQYLEERRMLENEEYCKEQTERYMEKEIAWRREIRERELPWKDKYIKRGSSVNGGDADGDWKTLSLPGYLAEAGLENFCGTLLLRKKFQVSEACAGKEALLRLGTLTDADRTYVNGVFVGDTGYCYPPRRYTVPAGVLKAGENEILIYLMCRNGGGRMTKGKTIELAWEDVCSDSWVSKYAATYNTEPSEGSVTFTAEIPAPISLAGIWEYQVLSEAGPAPEQVFLNRGATGLFHGMVAPCLSYTVSGVVWYQGESNDCKPEEYQGLLPDMIADWRNRWMQERLPFVVVQLPNCGIDIAKGDAWPQIREAQRQAGSLLDVAVTVNIDIGEDNDLHPLNKKEAAHRAALALRKLVYHEDVVSEGPRLTGYLEAASNAKRFQNGRRDLPPTEGRGRYPEAASNAKFLLKFDQELAILDCVTGQVLPADFNGGEGGSGALPFGRGSQREALLKWEPQAAADRREGALPFEFAGEDGIWQPLDAIVSGKEIALVPSNSGDIREEAQPFRVRYAWSSAPGRYLLAAAADGESSENGGSRLPVSPFLMKLVPDKE
ncbi:MAG: sialate O-acetylesterase [Clostridiales bacterium]|nr:sialate O-acetylesterase [Clostridiales bacterium]